MSVLTELTFINKYRLYSRGGFSGIIWKKNDMREFCFGRMNDFLTKYRDESTVVFRNLTFLTKYVYRLESIYSPKESSLKNSSSGSYCFCRDFTCFIVWKFLDPYDLYLYCDGWVVVVGRNLAYASELGLLPNFLWVLKTTKFLIPIASY